MKQECPIENNCQQQDVVYQVTVVNKNKGEIKKYIGSTTEFKTRYNAHKNSFKNDKYKNSTT